MARFVLLLLLLLNLRSSFEVTNSRTHCKEYLELLKKSMVIPELVYFMDSLDEALRSKYSIWFHYKKTRKTNTIPQVIKWSVAAATDALSVTPKIKNQCFYSVLTSVSTLTIDLMQIWQPLVSKQWISSIKEIIARKSVSKLVTQPRFTAVGQTHAEW